MDDPSLFSRVLDFAGTVLWNWKGLAAGLFLVSGPLLQLLPPAFRQRFDKVFPPEPHRRRILIGICFVFLFMSCFQAYDDISRRLRQKEDELTEVLKEKSVLQKNSDIVIKLKEYLTEAESLIEKGMFINADTSDEDYKRWAQSANQWSIRLEKYQAEKMGPGVRARMMQPILPPIIWNSKKSQDHGATMTALINMKQNLAAIIENPSWIKQ